MTDKPCATCGHPQNKHGDQIETYGCYAWDNRGTRRVCICEEFVAKGSRDEYVRRKHEEARIFLREKRTLGWGARRITDALNEMRCAEEQHG